MSAGKGTASVLRRTLIARSGRPACLVIVRSQNPDTLQSLSIAAVDAPATVSAPADSLH